MSMKRAVFLLWTILLSFNNLAQQLPNNSFENWDLDHYDDLLYYTDGSNEGFHTISKSSEATDGNYSIKMQTIIDPDGELQPGYFINFDPDDFSGGVPYSTHVSAVRFNYKAHLVAQDTALFLTFFKYNGNPISAKIIKIAADQNTNTWQTYQFDTDMPPGSTPDTLMIGAASSNAIAEVGMQAGSWFQVDNVEFLDASGNVLTPIVNHSFEDWGNIDIEKPSGFETSLNWSFNTNPLSVEKVPDPSEGNFAIKLNNVEDDEGDIYIGTATNGNLNSPWPHTGGFALTTLPLSISFDVKTHRVNNDDGGITFVFKNNGSSVYETGKTYTNDIQNYLHENVTVDQNIVADTLVVNMWNGNTLGSSMQIDNIMLHYPVGINRYLNVEELKAFPVPAKNQLHFAITAQKQLPLTINIININGQVVNSKAYQLRPGSNQIKLSLGNLPAGIYLYQLKTYDQILTKQFLIK